MKRLARFSAALAVFLLALPVLAQIGGPVIGQGGATTYPLLAADGTICTNPSYAFTSNVGTGFAYQASGVGVAVCASGSKLADMFSTELRMGSASLLGWNGDLFLVRDGAANILAQKNAANGQTLRVYGTTTGPKYLSLSHDGVSGNIDTAASSGPVNIAAANAVSVVFGLNTRTTGMQLRVIQQTAPVCSTNCGTSPSVAGSDTAMVVTLGTTPASAFLITFNATWAAAPSCVSVANTAGTTKAVTSVTTTTSTATVTTAAAPATGDKYNLICMGVS